MPGSTSGVSQPSTLPRASAYAPAFRVAQSTMYDPMLAVALVHEAQRTKVLPAVADVALAKEGVVTWRTFKRQGTEGTVAIFPDHIRVAFRGSDEKGDWQDNFDMSWVQSDEGEVHSGFSTQLDRVLPEMRAFIEQQQGVRQRPVYLTGHSLGGALAILAANAFSLGGIDVGGVYTFGAPKVGSVQFAERYNRRLGDKTHRVELRLDPVPNYPLEARGWGTVGASHYIDASGSPTSRSRGFDNALTRFGRNAVGGLSGQGTRHDLDAYAAALEQGRR